MLGLRAEKRGPISGRQRAATSVAVWLILALIFRPPVPRSPGVKPRSSVRAGPARNPLRVILHDIRRSHDYNARDFEAQCRILPFQKL